MWQYDPIIASIIILVLPLLLIHIIIKNLMMNEAAASESESDTIMMFCASCGTAEAIGDDIKLKDCSACHLVKYCSVKCQKDHRKQHKKACKRRAAELRDELLFKQPEGSFYGDCPLCCLPLPVDAEKSALYLCCSKRVCEGCNLANSRREIEGRLQHKCPFCREPLPKSDEQAVEQLMKRIEVNDPFAICHMGRKKYDEGDYAAAFEYWMRAAALGDANAHNQLSVLYHNGEVIEKDDKKELYHLTEAAIGGNPYAHYNLALLEGKNGQHNRSVKHLIIAAKLGHDDSLDALKIAYEAFLVSKEDFAAALRGHQAAIEATKSPQREETAEYLEWLAERKRRGLIHQKF